MKIDENYESDDSENEEQHNNLINAISQLDSKERVKAPVRKEISSVISEFHLPKTSKSNDLVNVKELAAVLNRKAAHTRIRNKVSSVIKRAKTLPKPLEKPVAERLARTVGYGTVKEQLNKWNSVVERNRVADHLTFPLQQGRVTLQSSQQFLSKFKNETALEAAMNKILKGEKKEMAELKKKDEDLEFPLTFEEMMEKKKELAKFRAKMSYQEAKAHRQNKIKSKKYHRILKREKVKQQLKDFEQLQKTDPEAALKKLEELDKTRAQERASLRHKNTGKWARNLAVRAKYDKDSRKVLAEQLRLGRDLTEKVKNMDSDDDASDSENAGETVEASVGMATSNDNPWALSVSSEITDFVSGFRKYWENLNKNAESVNGSVNSIPKIAAYKTEAVKDTEEKETGNVRSETVTPDAGDNEVQSEKRVDSNVKTSENFVTISENGKSGKNDKNIKDKAGKKLKEKRKKLMEMKIEPPLKKGEQQDKNEEKVCSTTGSWAVEEINDAENEGRSKRQSNVDIDDLFDDLNEKLKTKRVKLLKNVKMKPKKKKERRRKQIDTQEDVDLSMKKNPASLRPDEDVEMTETARNGEVANSEPQVSNKANGPITHTTENGTQEVQQIDPTKFIQVKPKKLNTKLPDAVEGEEDFIDDDDGTAQKMNIVEAFDADDVTEEFQEMKKEEESSSKLEVAGELPGWGSWGGSGIKPRERKTRRKGMIHVPPLPKRKDHDKEDMIIREMSNAKAVEHMVKDVPFPFQSVGAFESNIRHPIGREWVPESAHRKFVRKPIETQMGTIIEPMDENELLRLKKERKSLYKAKKKELKR